MGSHRELDRIAARQHHLVTMAQCLENGLTAGHVHYRVATGLMVLVRPTVYRWCGAKPTWRMMAMAAVLAAGHEAVLSHRSAAALWGLINEGEDELLEITHPKARRLTGVQAHRHGLTRNERTTRFGIPVTTIERTLLDLAESFGKSEIGRLIDQSLRRNLTTMKKLAAVLSAHEGPAVAARTVSKRPSPNEALGTTPAPTTGRSAWTNYGMTEVCPKRSVNTRFG